jgi:hypothetical protein
MLQEVTTCVASTGPGLQELTGPAAAAAELGLSLACPSLLSTFLPSGPAADASLLLTSAWPSPEVVAPEVELELVVPCSDEH